MTQRRVTVDACKRTGSPCEAGASFPKCFRALLYQVLQSTTLAGYYEPETARALIAGLKQTTGKQTANTTQNKSKSKARANKNKTKAKAKQK